MGSTVSISRTPLADGGNETSRRDVGGARRWRAGPAVAVSNKPRGSRNRSTNSTVDLRRPPSPASTLLRHRLALRVRVRTRRMDATLPCACGLFRSLDHRTVAPDRPATRRARPDSRLLLLAREPNLYSARSPSAPGLPPTIPAPSRISQTPAVRDLLQETPPGNPSLVSRAEPLPSWSKNVRHSHRAPRHHRARPVLANRPPTRRGSRGAYPQPVARLLCTGWFGLSYMAIEGYSSPPP